MSAVALFWLCPLLPFAAFALLLVGAVRGERAAAWLAVGTMSGSVVMAVQTLLGVAAGDRARIAIPWLQSGGRRFALALGADPLGAVVAALVAAVALVVFVYAVSYMPRAQRRRFLALLSLFAASMLTLVLAADLVTLFVAWELVGLCSYLLIGFRVRDPEAAPAASKALLTTRLADLAMLAGVLLLIGSSGSADIGTSLATTGSDSFDAHRRLLIALLLFVGAAGKSAQLPFQGWLPDAMVGPTPVSALLHSATMVAAGVFLVARLYPLFQAADSALSIVAWIGAATALLGATAALVQTDLKRLLAYSTISQLGLMFVGLGAGSLTAGVLLLIAHAFYKAALFLAAGAIERQVGSREFARMGGLARTMPLTLATFALAAAALAGLPVTLALPPKEPALAAASAAGLALYVVSLLASVLTALYSARAFALTFLGKRAAIERGRHEAPRGFAAPMVVMAALVVPGLAVDAGWLGHPLEHVLGAAAPESPNVTMVAFVIAVAGVALGIAACRAWPRSIVWPPLVSAAPLLAGEWGFRPLYRGLAAAAMRSSEAIAGLDGWLFDRFARALAQAAIRAIGRLAQFDRARFDAPVSRVAVAMLSLVQASGRFDGRRFDAAVAGFGQSLLAAGQRVRAVQSGQIDNYLLAVFGWTLALILAASIGALPWW